MSYLRNVVGGREVPVTAMGESVSQLKGAEVSNVRMEVRCGEGSDDEMEIVIVTFKFRPAGEREWLVGEMVVITDFSFLKRHIVDVHFWSSDG
ncbi:MAG: hypothetical protein ACP5N6_09760 [Anaerolineae bacterium]